MPIVPNPIPVDTIDSVAMAALRNKFAGRVRVDEASGCHVWTGDHTSSGYGVVRVDGVGRVGAHRLAYTLENGPIPDGMLVLHRCDNPACVNASGGHLFTGTAADNVRDKVSKGRHSNQTKTHCVHGHAFDEKNTLIRKGARQCRECKNAREREAYAKDRENKRARANELAVKHRERKREYERTYSKEHRAMLTARRRAQRIAKRLAKANE